MRRILLATATLLAGCPQSDVFASDSFDYDRQGWSVEGIQASVPTLEKNFGNPPASICAGDDDDAGWRFNSPMKYQGDASKYYGRLITWDATTTDVRAPIIIGADGGNPYDFILLSDGGHQPVPTVPVDSVFIGTHGLTISTRADFDAAAGIDWTPLSVTLDTTSHWTHPGPDGHAVPATQDEILRVLQNLTLFKIRGGWSINPEQGCIDNIYFGTK